MGRLLVFIETASITYGREAGRAGGRNIILYLLSISLAVRKWITIFRGDFIRRRLTARVYSLVRVNLIMITKQF